MSHHILAAGTWLQAAGTHVRDSVTDRLFTVRQRRDDGAVGLEYVIIAAVVFVVVTALAAVIATAIQNRQSDITP